MNALKHPTTYIDYTVEERRALAARGLAEESQKCVLIRGIVSDSQLSR